MADRDSLQDILAKTEGFTIALKESLTSITSQIPGPSSKVQVKDLFEKQEGVASNMANHLESLASHYDQMAAVLKDKEEGIEHSEEDLEGECLTLSWVLEN